MTDALDARREFVDWLSSHPLVDAVDFSRNGYQTVRLQLGSPEDSPEGLESCGACGVVGLPERIADHDCLGVPSAEYIEE